jgi:6-pyruvoyl-tetrahydropterin synthase related domain
MALLAAMSALCVLLLAYPILAMGAHVPLNHNEGWNAYFAMRAIDPALGPLYPDPGDMVFDNYPPLSFYIVGALGRLCGDVVLAGRVVALASFLGCALLLIDIARRLGASWQGALFGALLFVLCGASFYRTYIGADDPQWLAHALMLAACAVALRGTLAPVTRAPQTLASQTLAPQTLGMTRPVPQPGWICAAAGLMLLGGLVKHNILALPLSLTLWLALRDRRAALLWCACGLVGVLAVVPILDALEGGRMFVDILGYKRLFFARRALLGLTNAVGMAGMIVPLWLVWRQRGAMGSPYGLVCLFSVLALLLGIVQRTGVGVAYNAQFELLIALSLATGVALSSPLARTGRRRQWLALVAMLPILIDLPASMSHALHDLSAMGQDRDAWQRAIGRIAAIPGPVGCGNPLLCYWAGKPFVIDLFNANLAIAAGASMGAFRDAATHGAYAAFVLDARVPASRAVMNGPTPVTDFIRRTYTIRDTRFDQIVILSRPDGAAEIATR